MLLRLFIIAFCFLICFQSSAQSPGPEQANATYGQQGRILFSAASVDWRKARADAYLQQYELTNSSNLYITAFIGKPLTSYMQQLAPQMPVDSLHRTSGYRFALYIDGKLIYSSDIQGAPLPAVRDTETVLNKPLIDNEREGTWWTQFFWGRFMANGGDSALSDGRHLLRMEIRPHVRDAAGAVIAAGELPLLVNRKPAIDVSKITLSPVSAYPGLPVSTASFNRNLIKTLKGKIALNEFKRINGIVVLKNGKLLIEEYFNGSSRSSLHDSRSVGKSFASTMTGLAIRDGHISGVDQPLKEFYPLSSYANYAPAKEAVTIRDLLTMNSVLDGDDSNGDSPGNEENMYPTSDWVKFTLDLPVTTTIPRGTWHYFTAGVMLLGDILNNRVPGGLEQYTKTKLFEPLGIKQYQWVYTPQRVPSTAGGLQLCAPDLAKYGQLYKNGGLWAGRQVIPRQWVNETFQHHLAIPDRKDEYYGYLFWNKQYTVKGQRCETYYCTGNGGNKIFIFKDQPLVIVITASAYGQPYAHPQVDRMMMEYILPAVLD